MTENKITMPASYAVLNADEMMYTDGGDNTAVALGGTLALGSIVAGVLMCLPGAKYYTRMETINETIENEIYAQTILYLQEHTDANQMLAEYEGRTTYLASDRYAELMDEYNACKMRYYAWDFGGLGVMLIGSLVGAAITTKS